MKKLITICLIITATFTVNAQNISFEETVKYINDKITCCATEVGTLSTGIQVFPNGYISIKHTNKKYDISFNFFDLVKPAPEYVCDNCDNGIGITHGYPTSVAFYIKPNFTVLINFATEAEAQRVLKAFLHLRSLCVKTKDPFQN